MGLKLLRGLGLFIMALTLTVHLAIYIVLSVPYVQRKILDSVNEKVLTGLNVRAEMDSISVRLIPMGLTLRKARLIRTHAKDQCQGAPCDASILLDALHVDLHVLESWQLRRPVVEGLHLQGGEVRIGVNDDGSFVLPFKVPESNDDGSEPLGKSLASVLPFLPQKLTLENLSLRLGRLDLPLNPSSMAGAVVLKEAVFTNGGNAKISRLALEFSSLSLSRKSTAADAEDRLWNLAGMQATLTLSPEMVVELERMAMASPDLQLEANGKLRLPRSGKEKIEATARFTTQGDLGFALGWLDIKAQGKFGYEGTLSWNGTGLPRTDGRAWWGNGARIDVYDLYSGETKVSLKEKIIAAEQLSLRTDDGGQIKGRAHINLQDDGVEIEATTRIESLPFTTLMKGIDVATDAVAFQLDSPEARFQVSVQKGGEHFELKVSGPIATSQLQVPSMHTATRSPLPSCSGELQLLTNSDHLDMKGTWLSCNRDSSDKTILESGYVNYSTGKTDFVFDARGLELTHADYFLMDAPEFFRNHPTTGTLDLRGSITSKGGNSSPILFESSTHGRNVRLYGVDFKDLQGDWGIDDKGVWGRALEATTGQAALGRVFLDAFRVNFDDVTSSRFDGHLEGPLPELLASVQGFVGDVPAKGDLKHAKVSLSGPFSPKPNSVQKRDLGTSPLELVMRKVEPFLAWDSTLNLEAHGVEAFGLSAKTVLANVVCRKLECRDSRVALDLSAQKSGEGSGGYLFADLGHFNTRNIDLKLRLRDVDLRRWLPPEAQVAGLATASLDVSGDWKGYRAWIQGSVDAIEVGKARLGTFEVTGETAPGEPLDLRLQGHYGQLQARLRIPQSLAGTGNLFVALNSFNFSSLVPEQTRISLNLLGQADAEFTAEGPGPLATRSETATWLQAARTMLARLGLAPTVDVPWYKAWQVQGKLKSASGYIKQIPFATEGPTEIEFGGDKLSLKHLVVRGGAAGERELEARADALFDVRTFDLVADFGLHAKIKLLPKIFPHFGSSNGTIDAAVKASGKLPAISWKGEGQVRNGDLLVQALPPSFRNVEMRFTFNDKSVEIDSLRGNKGEGSFEASGYVDWEDLVAGKDTLPALRLDLTTQHFQSRIPIPVLQYIDTEADATLSVCRKASCEELTDGGLANPDEVLLAGSVLLHDAHITRNLDCSTILNAAGKPEAPKRAGDDSSILGRLRLALTVDAPGTLAVNTACARSRFAVNGLQVDGTAASPNVIGRIETADTSGSGQLGNIRFAIENATVDFDGRYDNPHYDVMLSTSVAGYGIERQRIDYKVFIHLDDRPLNQRRNQPEIRAEPPTHPDGQRLLTQTDLVAMVVTGRGPDASSPMGISTEFIANEFATAGTNAIFSEAKLESSVSRMLNRLSAGVVDRVSIEPVFEAGRPRFRLQATMIPVETVNVNVETDQDPSGSEANAKNGALTAAWVLNNRINLGLNLRRSEGATEGAPVTMGTGITFRFGGE